MMTYPFLSNDWFTFVHELNTTTGDLPLPPTLQTLIINFRLQDENERNLHLKAGKLWQNSHDHASATLILDCPTLQALIFERRTDAIIDAFMTGKIRVEGDMSALLSLQSAKPSTEQKALYKQILAMTEF